MGALDILGINDDGDDMPEEVSGFDQSLIADLEEELGAVAPSLTVAQKRTVANTMARNSSVYETFAKGAAMRLADYSVRPNASIGFFGPTAGLGTTYAGNTLVTLVPRKNNVINADLATLAKGVTIIDLMVSPVDASNGWRLAEVKLGSDPLGSMLGDTSIDLLRHDLGPNRSPIKTYLGQKIMSDTKLTISMIHDRAAAQEIIGGVTLTLIDRRCAQPAALGNSDAAMVLKRLFGNLPSGTAAKRIKLLVGNIKR